MKLGISPRSPRDVENRDSRTLRGCVRISLRDTVARERSPMFENLGTILFGRVFSLEVTFNFQRELSPRSRLITEKDGSRFEKCPQIECFQRYRMLHQLGNYL